MCKLLHLDNWWDWVEYCQIPVGGKQEKFLKLEGDNENNCKH